MEDLRICEMTAGNHFLISRPYDFASMMQELAFVTQEFASEMQDLASVTQNLANDVD